MGDASMRRRLASVALIAGAALAAAGVARAQVAGAQPAGDSCAGSVVGTLGILDMDCGRSGCAVTFRGPEPGSDAWKPEWSFTVEPRITRITPDSPADGVLQVGDRIVAVDGFLITTEEGGRRFANLAANSTVTIRYRRGGRTRDAALRAVARCGPGLEGGPSISPPSMPTTVQDSMHGRVVVWNGPGILFQTWTTADGRQTVMTLPGLELGVHASGGSADIEIPESRYGMNFACGPCSSTMTNRRRVWRFSNPIEVVGVEEGGPAEAAGLRVGDRITHLNGARIDSQRGGEVFSSVQPGVPVELTVVAPDGAERTTTLVPRERE